MSSIPNDINEAAAVEGATGWRKHKTLTLHLLRPFIKIAIVLNIFYVINSFPIKWITTQMAASDGSRFTNTPACVQLAILGRRLSRRRALFATAMLGLTDNIYLLLLLLNLLLFVVGMFLVAGPAILILGPILSQVFVGTLGVDPVHFAIIMCVNVTVGLATPPMGLVKFVTEAVAREKVENITRAILQFWRSKQRSYC